MRSTVALAVLLLPAIAFANPFPKGDPKIGEKLAKEKNCEACHIKIMGGDGSGIYTRKGRLINTPEALLQRVGACRAARPSCGGGRGVSQETVAHVPSSVGGRSERCVLVC